MWHESTTERQLREKTTYDWWSNVLKQIQLSTTERLSVDIGRSRENIELNRNNQILPYDFNRVRLLTTSNDYINASFIAAPHASRNYIVAQAPMLHNIHQIWLAAWEQMSPGIVMLNNWVYRNEAMCCRYYPTVEEPLLCLPQHRMRILLRKFEYNSLYEVRYCTVSVDDETRELKHFRYLNWPASGLPQSQGEFLQFLMLIRQQCLLQDMVMPPIVHCTDGGGRSGVLLLVDICLALIEKEQTLNKLDIAHELQQLRRQRNGLVQSPEQLHFCYMAVMEGARITLSVLQCGLSPSIVPYYIIRKERQKQGSYLATAEQIMYELMYP